MGLDFKQRLIFHYIYSLRSNYPKLVFGHLHIVIRLLLAFSSREKNDFPLRFLIFGNIWENHFKKDPKSQIALLISIGPVSTTSSI